MTTAMLSAMKKASGGRGNNKAKIAAMQAMMEQMFGGSVPTLRTILGDEHLITIRASSNVREAAAIMKRSRKALLVMDDGKLVGMLTPKTFCYV
jgi:hypothetical protein